MKLLIYGIDGGDFEVMSKFDMPFLSQLIADNDRLDIHADLYNRGWVEILTGQNGHHTGGYYMSPTLDGTHRFSTSFRMDQVSDSPQLVPLWDLLDRQDIPFLLMNIPTTTPAPAVKNGVIIGSLGGGLNEIDGYPDSLFSNTAYRQYLENSNYIVDIRIPNWDYKRTEDLFDGLVDMESIRTDCFIDINRSRSFQFGFLVNRGTTIASYLARSEIETFNSTSESWAHQKLKAHFHMVDQQIKKLHEQIQPENFIVVADHGSAPHRYRVNLNSFLLQFGYLRFGIAARFAKLAERLRRFFRIKNPPMLKSVQKKRELYKALSNAIYNWKKTRAFTNTYVPGVFINDERFDGPVRGKEKDRLVDEIVDKFNSIPATDRIDMKAVTYRRHLNGPYADKTPDVKITNCDGVFFDTTIPQFVNPNQNYGPIPQNLSLVRHAAFTGDKSSKPFCLISSGVKRFVHHPDPHDLTLIYKLVQRIFSTEGH